MSKNLVSTATAAQQRAFQAAAESHFSAAPEAATLVRAASRLCRAAEQYTVAADRLVRADAAFAKADCEIAQVNTVGCAICGDRVLEGNVPAGEPPCCPDCEGERHVPECECRWCHPEATTDSCESCGLQFPLPQLSDASGPRWCHTCEAKADASNPDL